MRYIVYTGITAGLLLVAAGLLTGQWVIAAVGAAFIAYYIGSAKWLARREVKAPDEYPSVSASAGAPDSL